MLAQENIYIEELGIYFTYNPTGTVYSKAIQSKMDRFHFAIQKGRSIKIKELEKACRNYPEVPQFKNYLANIYQKNKQWDKFKSIVEEIREKHPNYLFGKINLARYYLEKNELDKIPELLGDSLKFLHPDQELFHETEISSYYAISYYYYQAIGDNEKENFCIDILEKVNPNHPLLFEKQMKIMEENMERLEKEDLTKRRVKAKGHDTTVQTDEKPVFTHSEIWQLYKYGTNIPEDLLEVIMLLPRESCIKDLETVLEDSIKRYEYYESISHELSAAEYMFNEHALYLLAEFEAKESIGQILRLLRQGSKFLDFWFGDALDEVFNEVLYKIEHEQLDIYKDFLLEPDTFTYARTIMSNIVREVYYLHPERKDEVINWYKEIYEYFLANPDDHSLIDSDLIGLMVWANTDMNLIALEPILKKLWDKEWIPLSMMGDWKEISESLHLEDIKYRERIRFFTLTDRYKYIEDKWYSSPDTTSSQYEREDLMKPDNVDEFSNYRSHKPLIRTSPKIGRNEPCPCGSGKKYKKCCLGK